MCKVVSKVNGKIIIIFEGEKELCLKVLKKNEYLLSYDSEIYNNLELIN